MVKHSAKKKVARKPKQLKPEPPPHRPCSRQPCKKTSAYCRMEDGEMVRYCADHWKSVVESKKEFARAVTRHAKAEAARRLAATHPKKRKVKIKKK